MQARRLVIPTLLSATTLGTAGAAALIAWRIIHPVRSRPTQILDVFSDGRIVLESTPMTRQDGELGLLYDDESQHAVLGPILNIDREARIERALAVAPGSTPPLAGTFARPIGNVFATAESVSPDAREVTINTACGAAPAWLFPGTEASTTTWAIHIHGSLSGRDGAFRSVHSLLDTGFTSLVPSMRGDGDGPPAPHRAFTLGQTEWLDIEEAIDYAVAQGAQRILLIGWSSGASMALRLAASSKHKILIDGLILIAPVISWRNSVLHNAAILGVPSAFVSIAIAILASKPASRVLGLSRPLHFAQLDWLSSNPTRLPILAFHSQGDRVTPYVDTNRFAMTRGASVELVSYGATEHALEWNVDSVAFERSVIQWLPKAHRREVDRD